MSVKIALRGRGLQGGCVDSSQVPGLRPAVLAGLCALEI